VTTAEAHEKLLRALENSGPALLDEWYWRREIGDEGLRALILEVWGMCEWPAQALDEETWLDWFYRIGFVSDRGQPPPAVPLTVWRGASIARGYRGFSWTTDRAVARWFADRETFVGRRPAGVWEAVVPPGRVLAIHAARDAEPEVIVDPTYFDDLTDADLKDLDLPTVPRLVEQVGASSSRLTRTGS
jgi:hypothetical protein